jgi:type I restriction enzyme S subunit
VSPAYYVYRPLSQEHDQFIHYLLRSHPYIALYRRISKGVRVNQWDLEHEALRRVPVLLPDLATQKAIADFLDRETARIDQLIGKKERQVALLGEKLERQNVECITFGLNGGVTKRTTNIEWAHEIPVHWSVANLRQLFASAEYGISESMSDEGEIAVLRMGNIQNGEIVYDSLGFVNRVDRRLTLRSGDLLFNRTNSRDLVGKVGIFRRSDGDKLSFASYLVRIRPSEITQSEYLNLLLNSRPVLGAARALAIPSISQSNLNPNRYGSIPVPVPPVSEQNEIAAHLSQLISKNNEIEQRIRGSLDRLRELRAALITAAVTGQIDVATWGKRGRATDRRLDAIESNRAAAAQLERQQARA